MTRPRTTENRGETQDEDARPHTSASTEAQIEAKKKLRETGAFPPERVSKDEDVHAEVERGSWNRLKRGPRETPDKPPYDRVD